MIDAVIHFIKHFIGLCGESHPSLLVTGTAFFTGVWVSWKRVVEYIKGIDWKDLLPKKSSIAIWIIILIIYLFVLCGNITMSV